jgi:hypothetical protein
MVGNVDCSDDEVIDIGDITAMIRYLFIDFEMLPCPMEANADGDPDGSIDVGDLTAMIDFFFISGTPLPNCP